MTDNEDVFSAEAIVVSNSHDEPLFLDITVLGEPRAQKQVRHITPKYGTPRIYDPSADLKTKFQSAVKQAIVDLGHTLQNEPPHLGC
jgi:hypothetical protein